MTISSSPVEIAAPTLLGEVQVAEDPVLDANRHPEEGAHRRVPLREPVALQVAGQIVQPQGPRFADEHAEDAASDGVMPDAPDCLRVSTFGDELDQPDLVDIGPRSEHSEGRVLGIDKLARAGDDAPQHDRQTDRGTSC